VMRERGQCRRHKKGRDSQSMFQSTHLQRAFHTTGVFYPAYSPDTMVLK
jgi:hypothetical protein